ncbi:MAG TPA: Gfo/Idh/MocA family oxidoreductase [Chloroflexota bacterium]|nr:Gfo/Idh/MocA family oxidoreductase [Chloroflexota bacterium]
MAGDVLVRVGICGLGVAARQVRSSIDRTRGAKLTAVCDVRKSEVDAWTERYDLEGFTDIADLCRSSSVDAIWVATPNNLHAEHTVMAADHGKHVICEKPMAISIDEATRMVDAIERNGVKYIQGHSRIHRPYVHKMGEVIASGRLGQIVHINSWMYNDWMQRPWEVHSVDERLGGGVVFRQGPHQMDVVRYLAGGLVRSVRGTAGYWHPHYHVPGDYHAFIDFEDGPTAMISFVGYGNFDIRELTWNIGEGGGIASDDVVLGPKPRATGDIPADQFYALDQYSLDAFDRRDQARRKQDFFGLIVVSCERGDIRQSPDGLFVYTEKGREEVLLSEEELRAGEIQALVDAVKQDGPGFPDVRWGRATLEACMAIKESGQQRREIMMQHQVPSPLRPALQRIGTRAPRG